MVICVDGSESQVPSRNCDSENKPPKVTVCNNEECLPQWSVGHWSEVNICEPIRDYILTRPLGRTV
jgi:hypothetical protein